MFEITKRDGLARIGKFQTRSGTIETPALLPVVNPKICTVSPKELKEEFGFGALITNSYIIKQSPELREKALSEGLHKMLEYDGIIMTDSGTFQSHMYGDVQVTNKEMVDFQRDIGSDIGTVLDIFTEPYWTRSETAASIETTLERMEEACSLKGEMMINGVVQGSIYPDLREDCARRMASMDIDVHPIGGVVPLMEQYRYSELVDVIIASKKGLSSERPVHLFGAGHPMVLALASLLGCDLFDSASYAKFARDDRLMFVDGTFRLADMQSLDCDCPACRGRTVESLRKEKKEQRAKIIAKHNLYQIKSELALVKRYIREGRLWELVEIRCRAHPSMLDALRKLKYHATYLETLEPISRDGAMFYTGSETRGRPLFERYKNRIMERYVPLSKKVVIFPDGGKPYTRVYGEKFAIARSCGYSPVVESPFGPVPAELDEMYPLAQSLFPSILDSETKTFMSESMKKFVEHFQFNECIRHSELPNELGNEEYDANIERAKAVARYQFGIDAANALMKGKIELVISRKTGKIRNVISDGEHVLSMRASDGLYTLRPEGASRILSNLPAPTMRAVVMDDASPFVSEGRNVFSKFLVNLDSDLRPMDEVIVVDSQDNLLAVGRIILTLDEAKSFKKGVAIKVRTGSGDDS